MKKLSAVLITFNEEAKIEAALSSLAPVCDEIVVVDSGSTDRTLEICRRYTDRIVEQPWLGYAGQKAFATGQATFEWVLNLDADEQLSRELAEEIATWKREDDERFQAYEIPRLTFFLGRWIRHTIWYPDWSLRLYRRSEGDWTGGRVHESFRVRGSVGRLSHNLLHYTYASVSEYLQQLDRFSGLAAADLHDRGVRPGVGRLLGDPLAAFFKSYGLKRGFLDGFPGLIVSILAMASTFFKLLKLWELHHCRRLRPSEWPAEPGPDDKRGSID